jgi:hypothetical protein
VKAKFEQWLDDSQVDDEAYALFHESILAHRAECYRAATIMAYLGLLASVRTRILKANAPTGFDASEWNKAQEGVRNDETRDSQVVDLLLREAKDKKPLAFSVSKDERDALRYFKMLRNNSAHGKSEEIGSSSVESLWGFVRGNLPRFVVNGSLQGAIRATLEHFDPDLTPLNESFDELAAALSTALRPDEVPSYLDALQREDALPRQGGASDGGNDWFFGALAVLSRKLDIPHRVAMKEWLELDQHFDVLRAALFQSPDSNLAEGLDSQVIRRLWHCDSTLAARDIRVYSGLRRNLLIPDGQLDESMEFTVSHVGYLAGLSVDEMSELARWDFWKHVKEFLLASVIGAQVDFKTANQRGWLMQQYLERFGVDSDIAGGIRAMESGNSPWRIEEIVVAYLHDHADYWLVVKSDYELPGSFIERVNKG